jgi:folate-dependent phosphoribosylglycinamide formyltransferase PurN
MKIFLVGHDNSGSQDIFKSLLAAFPDATFELAITTGLYYRKTVFQSIVKMLKESSFIFCAARAIELFIHRLKAESLSAIAKAAGGPAFKTADINGADTLDRIRRFAPDMIVSLFTMHIYRAEILSIPRVAAISAHPSVLPNYRGLEVFFWAMANREKEIGVSVFKLTPRIDDGLIANDMVLPLRQPDRVWRVYKETTQAACALLIKTIREIQDGTVKYREPKGPGSYFGMPTRDAMRRFWAAGHSLF